MCERTGRSCRDDELPALNHDGTTAPPGHRGRKNERRTVNHLSIPSRLNATARQAIPPVATRTRPTTVLRREEPRPQTRSELLGSGTSAANLKTTLSSSLTTAPDGWICQNRHERGCERTGAHIRGRHKQLLEKQRPQLMQTPVQGNAATEPPQVNAQVTANADNAAALVGGGRAWSGCLPTSGPAGAFKLTLLTACFTRCPILSRHTAQDWGCEAINADRLKAGLDPLQPTAPSSFDTTRVGLEPIIAIRPPTLEISQHGGLSNRN